MILLRLFAVIIILTAISACAVTPYGKTYLIETTGPYALDSGDVIRISVYGDEGLSGEFQVGDSGAISFPLVGQLSVRGLTTKQVASKISLALSSGYMRNPNVAVEIATYRPFFIQGEVANSGQYPYVYGMSARAAIAMAGGFTDTAERSFVIIYRRQDNQMIKGSVQLDFPIQPGDMIVIKDRWL